MSIERNSLSAGLLLGLSALALAACSGNETSDADKGSASLSSNPPEESANKVTADGPMKQPADSPGKPTAPIAIDYEVIGEPRPGEPLEIELEVRTRLEGPVQIDLQPRPGLQLGATQEPNLRFEAPAVRLEPTAERVVVIPSAEGRFYLSVLAAVDTPAGRQLRAVSVPIQVGDKPPTPQSNGELRTTAGETVRSLPARESNGD